MKETSKRQELVDEKKEIFLCISLIRRKAPQLPDSETDLKSMQKQLEYVSGVIETCDHEGWGKYYEIKLRLNSRLSS